MGKDDLRDHLPSPNDQGTFVIYFFEDSVTVER